MKRSLVGIVMGLLLVGLLSGGLVAADDWQALLEQTRALAKYDPEWGNSYVGTILEDAGIAILYIGHPDGTDEFCLFNLKDQAIMVIALGTDAALLIWGPAEFLVQDDNLYFRFLDAQQLTVPFDLIADDLTLALRSLLENPLNLRETVKKAIELYRSYSAVDPTQNV